MLKDYYNESMSVIITNPKYYAAASVIEIVILLTILYIWNPFKISEKFPVLCSIFIMFVVFFQLMTYFFVSKPREVGVDIIPEFTDLAIKIVFTLLTICAMAGIVATILWLSTKYVGAGIILVYALNIAILIFAATLLYILFLPVIDAAKTHDKSSNVIELIKSVIFYLPCAIIDIVDWAKNQYNITTKTIWILLSIEFLFISLRILVPRLMTFMINLNGVQLLRDPLYLNRQHEIGGYNVLHKDKDKDKTDYTYSISAWFWINPQPPNTRKAYTKYTNIIEYGRKPAVEFNGLENTLRVNCQIKDDMEITIAKLKDIKLQSWNNVVVNYDGSTMDVFLNGILVGSKPNIAPYITSGNIKIGEEKGLEGGICNVNFYNKILQEREINIAYKALREMPTPLI